MAEGGQKENIEKLREASSLARHKLYKSLLEKIARGDVLSASQHRTFKALEYELGITELEPAPEIPAPSPVMGLSIEELAKKLGKSLRTLFRWQALGMPRIADGVYDLESVVRWSKNKRRSKANNQDQDLSDGAPKPDDPSDDKYFWETRNKRAQAEMREIELKKRRGELVEVARVEDLFVSRITAVKAGLLTLPVTLPPELFPCRTEREMAAILEKSIRSLLDAFSRPIPSSVLPMTEEAGND